MDEQKTNKSSYLGIIIFLIIFAGISIGITYNIASNKKMSNENIANSEEQKDFVNEDDNLGIKDYTDYYYTNNLEIIEKIHTSGELIKEQYSEYYPLEIKYIEIKGLKNKEIENKINNEIKDAAFELSNDELKEYQRRRFVSYNVYSNMANILSFKLENHNYKNIYFNYDLTTGNQIKFEEVFTKNANIKEIVQNGLYETLNNPYEPYDEQAFELMYKYSKNDFDFSIYNDYVIMNFDDSWYSNYIYISEHYKDIAIFNRFMTTECIFENEELEKVEYGFAPYEKLYYIKDNVLVYLVDGENKYSKIFEEYTFKNKLYPIPTNKTMLSAEEVKMNNVISLAQNKILNVIDYSTNTPDTMHIIGIDLDLYYINIFKIECKKDKFYDEFKNQLIDALKSSSFLYPYFQETEEYVINKFDIFSFDECYINESGEFEHYNDYFPNSSKEILTKEELPYYDSAEFYNIAYNEIFARHGHDFESNDLKEHFAGKWWYLPTYGKKVSLEELNDVEKQNINILKNKIDKIKKYPKGFFELDETTYTVNLGYDWEDFQFSYSDDENKIGEIYTPMHRTLTYNEYKANDSTSATKEYFKGKYLHIILKDSKEIYQTIEIKKPKIFYGDVNDDGKVTANDADDIMKHIRNKNYKINFLNSDVNLDGVISNYDYALIVRSKYVYGKIELPHECEFSSKYERYNDERHVKIIKCKCEDSEVDEFYQEHTFIDGKCSICNCNENIEFVYGDVNKDGKLTSEDIKNLQEHLFNPRIYISKKGKEACDVNLDGKVDEINDCMILSYKYYYMWDEFDTLPTNITGINIIARVNKNINNQKHGDSNFNGIISQNDIEFLNRYILQEEFVLSDVDMMYETFFYNSDVDLNGILDKDDVTILQAYVDGKIKELPHSHKYKNGKCACGTEK